MRSLLLFFMLSTVLSGCSKVTFLNQETPPDSMELALADVSVAEGDTANVSFNLSSPAQTAFTLRWTISGTGAAGDFVLLTQDIAVNVGDQNISGSIATIENLLHSGDRVYTLEVSSTDGTTVASKVVNFTIIEDESVPVINFQAATQNANEGVGTANATLTISPASANNITVAYTLGAGTATATTDHTLTAGTIVIPAGSTTHNLPVPLVDDLVIETSETIIINLSSITAGTATVGATIPTHTLSIIDNESVNITIDDVSVAENGTATFTVNLSSTPASPVTFDWATSDGTATSGVGYTAGSGTTVTITPPATTATINVATINNATVCQADSTFNVTISNANGATIADATGVGTITDPDRPTISFSSSTASVNEGSSVNLVATLSAACATHAVGFDYASASGTATSGTDFTALSASSSIAAGSTTRNIAVTAATDTLYEDNEDFTVTLSNVTNGSLGATPTATVTIANQTAMPTVHFSAASQSVNENVGTATATLSLSAAAGVDVTVAFTTSGTATVGAGNDYTISASPVTITAGQTSVNVTYTINDDSSVESSETAILTMGALTNATAGTNTTHTLTITDNDLGAFNISGVTGNTDATDDAYLNTTVNPTINWGASTGASSYDVTVFANDGTTVACALQNTTSTSYNFSTCNLTAGSSYKAKVTAKASGANDKDATNSLFSFLVNRAPVANNDTWTRMYNGAASTVDPRGNDTDSDGHSLLITAVTQPSGGGTVAITGGGTGVQYTASSFAGADSFTYTVSDGAGGTATGTVYLNLMTQFTWTGAVSNIWATSGNWCNTVTTPGLSGSCSGGAAPNSTQTAYVNATCSSANCNPTVNADATVLGLVQAANTITISTGFNFTVAGGQSGNGFLLSGGTFNASAVGSPQIISFSKLNMSGGTLSAPTGNLNIGYDRDHTGATDGFVISGGTFTHNSGKVKLWMTGTPCSGTYSMRAILASAVTFNNLEIDFDDSNVGCGLDYNAVGLYITNQGMIVNGNLTITDGWFTGSSIELKGNLILACTDGDYRTGRECAGRYNSSTGKIVVNGNAAQTYTTTGVAGTSEIEVDSTGSFAPAAGTNLYITKLRLTKGTFTAPTGKLDITRYYDWNESATDGFYVAASGATFTPNGGTVVLGSDHYKTNNVIAPGIYVDVPTPFSFHHLEIAVRDTVAAAGYDTTVLRFKSNQVINVAGNYIATNGHIDSTNATLNVSGNITATCSDSDLCAERGNATINWVGNGAHTYQMDAGALIDHVVINTSGTYSPAVVGTNFGVHSFKLQSGTFTAPTGTMLIKPEWSIAGSNTVGFIQTGGTFNHNNGTLELGGDYSYFGGGSNTLGVFDVPSSILLNHVKISVADTSLSGGGYDNAVWTMGAGDQMTVNNLTITDGGIAGGTILVMGNLATTYTDAQIYAGLTSAGVSLWGGDGSKTISQAAGSSLPMYLSLDYLNGASIAITALTNLSFNRANQDFTINGGQLYMNGFNLSVARNLYNYDELVQGTTGAPGCGTVTVSGIYSGNAYFCY